MSELPKGWVLTSLESLSSHITYGFTAKSNSDSGDAKMLRITDIQENSVDWTSVPYCAISVADKMRYALRKWDLVFARTGATVGKSFLIREDHHDTVFASYLIRVRCVDGKLSSYLSHYFNSADYWKQITDFSAGIGQPNVNGSKLKDLKIPLAPFAEQARIVAKLEELLSDLDAGVSELKAAQTKLVQYRQSLLKAAVDGSLTAEWRKTHTPQESGAQLLERILDERRKRWEAKQLAKFQEQGKTPPKGWQDQYPQPVRPDTTNLPELPEGWACATMDQLTDFVTSGSRGWAEYYSEQGAVFIRSQDINTDKLCLDDVAFVDPPRGSEGARTKVMESDLLLTITGANVGKVAIVDVGLDEAYVSQHVALLRPVAPSLSSYLHMYLTAKAGGRAQLDKAAYGAGKPGLNLSQVGSVSVPLPPPLEMIELRSLVASGLDAIEAQLMGVDSTLAAVSAQRKNILKAAFSGQLVPQDPNDEPASVLLARIRAERVMQGVTSVRRGRIRGNS